MAKDYENTIKTESSENSKNNTEGNKDSFGRWLYPGRTEDNQFSWWEKLLQQTYDSDYCRIMCEYRVLEALKKNPILRLLKGALKNAGCPLDIKRHIVCENCSRKVQGGYDFEYNQIVICQNIPKVRDNPESILVHELIHMYDNCVNEIDFKNLEHLACTEIRAANIAHCSFLASLNMGASSPINIKKTHQYCVKTRAAQSLKVARGLEFPLAVKYVLKVFDKCYNDLEPVGRRIRRKSYENFMAEEEAKCFLISD